MKLEKILVKLEKILVKLEKILVILIIHFIIAGLVIFCLGMIKGVYQDGLDFFLRMILGGE